LLNDLRVASKEPPGFPCGEDLPWKRRDGDRYSDRETVERREAALALKSIY